MKKITRLANKSDIDRIHEIEVETFENPWSKKSIENAVVFDELSDILVVEVDGDIGGFISFMRIYDEIHIGNVAVGKNYRGQKLANDLFEGLIDLAERESYKMTLEVEKSNRVAFNLYKKFGFKIQGVRKDYYGIDRDAYIMWRE
ncbi:MAG: ribosomal protein S18-alanine N-acetyltransferase [Peptoniphilus harei]|uniref:ribosomal protein S18-alanine N-acetyltransferase n=1 Tax=Peptoniphilus harei TaxID=54005 RepID=UPI0029082AF4|nr:ribosomal protein S18-alanine N-acetyltransferase [Peptoniphilus harei]MDU5470999.1 ribosomal protein S18-alanine N-acetyltransferase [Peptoniphilus harei]MDU6098345.1 ribosomal protein S18-alanine N-acetyltransferase [Peptoniphilus harei]